MKLKLVASVAALSLICAIGCAPPPPASVDTSTEPAASGNVTASAETPGGNVTASSETPASETP